jgi:uncharacterized membrane protein YfcA
MWQTELSCADNGRRERDAKVDIALQLLLICPLVFLAGLMDSMVGGGGLISLPAYFVAGIPPHTALGTNKFTSTCGTILSTVRFIRQGKFHFRAGVSAGAAALFGSFLGARAALYLDPAYIRYILVIALPALSVFILMKKDALTAQEGKRRLPAHVTALSLAAGLVLGGYDGFFGPGAGTFLILLFNLVIGLDLLTASGTAKIVNLASNVAAFCAFLADGRVLFTIGIPAALCGIAGNYIGAGLALKRGASVIRPAFIIVLVLLLAKVLWDLLS